MKQDRRKFIKKTSAAATALFLSSMDVFATAYPRHMTPHKNLTLKVLATNWGYKGTLAEFCADVKKEGYDGIEIWWPMEQKGQDELFHALKQHRLEVGFLCGAWQADFTAHLDQFRRMIDAAALNKTQRPLYINCHSGKDFFSYEQNKSFIDHTTALAKQTGLTICHETHRSRMLYAAPVAATYLEKHPELRLTFDVSHWCNVSESLLQDQQQTVQLALQRTDHIHARIGHAQGPQVSDPRAPEWAPAVQAHLAWWDAVVEEKRKTGQPLTVLTEFGPPDYMPVSPYTRKPLADQWAINVHMMHLLRKRYQPVS